MFGAGPATEYETQDRALVKELARPEGRIKFRHELLLLLDNRGPSKCSAILPFYILD